jgi:hypothetical protein
MSKTFFIHPERNKEGQKQNLVRLDKSVKVWREFLNMDGKPIPASQEEDSYALLGGDESHNDTSVNDDPPFRISKGDDVGSYAKDMVQYSSSGDAQTAGSEESSLDEFFRRNDTPHSFAKRTFLQGRDSPNWLERLVYYSNLAWHYFGRYQTFN